MATGPVSRDARVAGREPVRMNPADADARGIVAGAVVELYNARGACLAGAVLDAAVMPGVVQLSTGAWFDPDPDDPDAPERGGNPNVLTRDVGASSLSQGSSAQSALVEARPWSPPARADAAATDDSPDDPPYDPPDISPDDPPREEGPTT